MSWRRQVPRVIVVGLGVVALVHCSVDYRVDPDFGAGGETGEGGAPDETGGGPSAGGSDGMGGSGDGGSTGGGGPTGGTTGVESCGEESVCVALAPSGWQGPIAFGTTDENGSINCLGTGYDTSVFSKLGGLDEGAADCSCECGTPTGMGCSQVTLRRYSNATACNTTGAADWTAYMLPGACQSTTGQSTSYSATVDFTAGSCAPSTIEDIDEPAATTRAFGCQTTDVREGTCEGSDLCLPSLEAPLERHCIHREGDHDCPAGAYSEKTTYFDEFSDERACEGCSCADPVGQCTGQVFLENACSATIEYGAVIYNGSCTTLSGAPATIYATPGPTVPSGSCQPEGGSLTGSVELSGAVTVCCSP